MANEKVIHLNDPATFEEQTKVGLQINLTENTQETDNVCESESITHGNVDDNTEIGS